MTEMSLYPGAYNFKGQAGLEVITGERHRGPGIRTASTFCIVSKRQQTWPWGSRSHLKLTMRDYKTQTKTNKNYAAETLPSPQTLKYLWLRP